MNEKPNAGDSDSSRIESEVPAKPDFSQFVAVDIETTGLKPSEGEIIELGAVRFINQEETETFHALVKPEHGFPERNRRLTGIDPSLLDGGRHIKPALEDFVKFIGDDLLISHNAPFDTKFLAYHLKKQDIEPIGNPALCTLHLSAVVNPEAKTLQLVTLAKRHGIAVSDPHRALQDARMAGRLFIKFREVLVSWPPEMLAHLASYRGKSLDPMFDLLDELGAGVDHSNNGWRLSDAVFERLQDADGDVKLPLLDESEEPQVLELENDPDLMGEILEAFKAGGATLLEDNRPGASPASFAIMQKDSGRESSEDTLVIAVPDESHIQKALGQDGVTDGAGGPEGAVYLGERREYICINRVFNRDGYPSGWLELSPYERVVFARWLAGSSTGRIARVNWWLLNNFSGLKGHLNSLSASGTDCICRHQDETPPCFAEIAQAKAQQAGRIIVTHKHLCMRQGEEIDTGRLLGRVGKCIVEGASRLHHAARASETRVLEPEFLRRAMLKHLESDEEPGQQIAETVQTATNQLKDLLDTSKQTIRSYRSTQPRDSSGPIPIDDESWSSDIFAELAGALSETSEVFIKLSEGVNPESTTDQRIKALGFLLADIARTVSIIRETPQGWTMSIEGAPARNPKRATLQVAPVDVSTVLQRVIGEVDGGFLAVDRNLRYQGSFERLKNEWGFSDESTVRERVLEDPSLVLPPLFLPDDVTSPTVRTGRRYHWEKYMERTANLLKMLAETLGGRTVAAFSAHHELRRVREILGSNPPRECIVLAQYMDGTRSALIREYLNNPETLLMGGRNFLDGVDFRPVGFTALVLVKLPFVSPEEPVHRAKLRSLEAQGIDGMQAHLVPIAVDSSNRWIDSLIAGPVPDNRDPGQLPGVVVILDPRALRNNWGDDFVSGLNAEPVYRLPFREMIASLNNLMQESSACRT